MAVNNPTYQIKLPQFEGPFDLLLFFIERDELDIYNIPINNIIKDFLAYIHGQETLNIELSSEFILFISTLMRIKAKMLLPRKEIDAQGNEIDPRQELIDKILEYKKYKEAAAEMALLEAERMLMIKRGNITKELSQIGEEAGEGRDAAHARAARPAAAPDRRLDGGPLSARDCRDRGQHAEPEQGGRRMALGGGAVLQLLPRRPPWRDTGISGSPRPAVTSFTSNSHQPNSGGFARLSGV